MTTERENPYNTMVNAKWPSTLPELSGQEAIAAVKKLLRHFGVKFVGTFRVTSGNRYTWPRRGVFSVNPERGWHHLVHLTAHYAHSRLNPTEKPHHYHHLHLERDMTAYVLEQGWLSGSLRKPEKAKPTTAEKQRKRHEAILRRITSWESKAKRAKNALAKLNRQRKYYERQQAA